MADCSPTAPTRVKNFWTFKPDCVAAWDRQSPTCWMANSTLLSSAAWDLSVIVARHHRLRRAPALVPLLPADAVVTIHPMWLTRQLPQGNALAAAETLVLRPAPLPQVLVPRAALVALGGSHWDRQ